MTPRDVLVHSHASENGLLLGQVYFTGGQRRLLVPLGLSTKRVKRLNREFRLLWWADTYCHEVEEMYGEHIVSLRVSQYGGVVLGGWSTLFTYTVGGALIWRA